MADAENKLRELLDKIAVEQNYKNHEYKIKPVSSGGANYTSALYVVTVKFPDREDVNLFAKVAIVGEQMRVFMGADRLFYLETFFYNQLAKTFVNLELKNNVSSEDSFSYPKFYGCITNRCEETIVMENMVAAGYSSYDRFSPIDWDHAAGAIDELAKFHALSFAYQKEKPEEFEEICKDLWFRLPEHSMEQLKAMWGGMIERSLPLIKNEEYRERLKKFLEANDADAMMKYRDAISVKVIDHGDYRVSNLLFKREESGVRVIPVDYQTLHVGCPAADLLYFEFLGSDGKFRAEHHYRLVNHYYKQLSAAMRRLGVDPNVVYPKKVFDKEYRQVFPYGLILAVLTLKIVLVEEQHAPRFNENDSSIDDFFNSKDTDQYGERFNEIVEDYVMWGVI